MKACPHPTSLAQVMMSGWDSSFSVKPPKQARTHQAVSPENLNSTTCRRPARQTDSWHHAVKSALQKIATIKVMETFRVQLCRMSLKIEYCLGFKQYFLSQPLTQSDYYFLLISVWKGDVAHIHQDSGFSNVSIKSDDSCGDVCGRSR